MKLVAALLMTSCVIATAAIAKQSTASMSDAQITSALIQQSIASTPGNCPCPFNTAANGSRCGKRSSYSRGGGYWPICYPEDVTPAMLARYRSNGG